MTLPWLLSRHAMLIRSNISLPQVASCSLCDRQQPVVQRCLPKPMLASGAVQTAHLVDVGKGIQAPKTNPERCHALFQTGKLKIESLEAYFSIFVLCTWQINVCVCFSQRQYSVILQWYPLSEKSVTLVKSAFLSNTIFFVCRSITMGKPQRISGSPRVR